MPEIEDTKKTLGFEPKAGQPFDGLALIFDLAEFTKFFNLADAHLFVPRFLNRVMEAIDILFFGGEQYWLPENRTIAALSKAPIHEKFLGDGALYVWNLFEDEARTKALIANIVARCWNLQAFYSKVVDKCVEELPVRELPPAIRFGLARGNLYELRAASDGHREYIGPCINLASRLQKYCPELRFIASARIDLPADQLKALTLIRVAASKIRGFPGEIVLLDKGEYEKLSANNRNTYFEKLSKG
jgi:class 3 adenylate cyclase